MNTNTINQIEAGMFYQLQEVIDDKDFRRISKYMATCHPENLSYTERNNHKWVSEVIAHQIEIGNIKFHGDHFLIKENHYVMFSAMIPSNYLVSVYLKGKEVYGN